MDVATGHVSKRQPKAVKKLSTKVCLIYKFKFIYNQMHIAQHLRLHRSAGSVAKEIQLVYSSRVCTLKTRIVCT
jgi:hypothetical protein